MRTSMGIVGALVCALAANAGCGGGGGEEVTGTLTIDWGTEHIVPDTGAAIENPDVPGEMIVAMGNLDFDCGWADDAIRPGTIVTFSLDPTEQAPGAYTPLISVLHFADDSLSSNGSTGTLDLTAVGERITGELSMSTTDDEAGPITTSGTFDVINCL